MMRDCRQPAPSELFPDVVGTPLGVEFDFVGLVRRHDCSNDLLPGRNYERMVAAGTDSRSFFTAGDRRPNSDEP